MIVVKRGRDARVKKIGLSLILILDFIFSGEFKQFLFLLLILLLSKCCLR